MSDIVTFLRARLDEDEAAAKLVVSLGHDDPEDWHEWYQWIRHSEHRGGGSGTMFFSGCPSPAQVLREVEAKRRIVDWCTGGKAVDGGYWMFPPLEMLAAVYADHPDYDPEWRLQAASTS